MGSTPFEVVRNIMLPYIKKSAIGAVMLGLGRALGETMAVTFIIGNSHAFPKGLFDSGSTIASTIANEFTEATGDMHVSALLRDRQLYVRRQVGHLHYFSRATALATLALAP